MRKPFTLYKEATKSGIFWYARFWDETAQKYKTSRSTGIKVEGKKERRYEAEEAARNLLLEIEEATKRLTGHHAAAHAVANTPLIQYLRDFWQPNSQYANFKKNVEKEPLSLNYIQCNSGSIDLCRTIRRF